jgi:hypothetical protein
MKSHLDKDDYTTKVVYKSCEPYNNWRGNTPKRLMSSMHPLLNIGTDNINEGLELVWNRLNISGVKKLQIKTIDYFDFAETCVILVGKPFITKELLKFANFLDNNVYYHEKRVIISSMDIPSYLREEIRNKLKITEII